MFAEKLVMMMEATSSIGSFFSPSGVLHVSCPSLELSEHCGESMLTMWKDMPPSRRSWFEQAQLHGSTMSSVAHLFYVLRRHFSVARRRVSPRQLRTQRPHFWSGIPARCLCIPQLIRLRG